MAKGETSFDASKRKVSKFDFKPPPPGEYHFKFRSNKAAITTADGVGKLPYIKGCQLELMDSAEEGGKNKTILTSFFLGVVPSPGSKSAAVDQGGGIVAFSKAIGVNLKLGEGAVIKRAAKDKTGKDYTASILDPKKVVAWLKEHDGATGAVKTRLRPDQTNPDKKWGDVDYFIEAEEAGEEEEDETDETEETEETDEEGEDEEGEDEEEGDEESDEETDEEDEESDEEDDEDEDEEEPEEKPAKKAKVKAGKKKGKK